MNEILKVKDVSVINGVDDLTIRFTDTAGERHDYDMSKEEFMRRIVPADPPVSGDEAWLAELRARLNGKGLHDWTSVASVTSDIRRLLDALDEARRERDAVMELLSEFDDDDFSGAQYAEIRRRNRESKEHPRKITELGSPLLFDDAQESDDDE